ncbi:type II toxin-antitoxin system RelE/ParE family toxin [Dehalobacterium formicoaceticum]|uniref:Type II toxin-antitoxin system RelE/ParE family toxin n=1 Tax=Dehalobacterium formicoaceticum TaxID=51515 RepID=A0ABT1XZK7_9FIRM|nr:type II toxin-antitoxin system RelE/ParE family toxin [Dehalobacterium formicoaceticum]MCR6544049.1 type II toxin-antitoxin system RelE/ParE family toxin [Dehalobacterium formicoaceticum]
MKQYKIQITDKALSDMEEIYNYIAGQLQAPEAAMGQYNRIANAIETLDMFPERVELMETGEERALGLRQTPVDNFSVFFHIREERVIITNVLCSAGDIAKRLRDHESFSWG